MHNKHYIMKSKTLPCSSTIPKPGPNTSVKVEEPKDVSVRPQDNKHSMMGDCTRASQSAEGYSEQWFQ